MLVSDHCRLKATDQINQSLELCLACLQLLLRRNHPNEQFLFPKLLMLLTEQRNILHEWETNGPLKKAEWLEFDVPPLLGEMFSTN